MSSGEKEIDPWEYFNAAFIIPVLLQYFLLKEREGERESFLINMVLFSFYHMCKWHLRGDEQTILGSHSQTNFIALGISTGAQPITWSRATNMGVRYHLKDQ